MKKLRRSINCLAILLIFFACTDVKTAPVKTYQYEYWVTTGIADHVCDKDKLVPIVFHPKSDKRKLKLLASLDPGILFASSDRIRLIGRLHEQVKKTIYPAGEGYLYPASEAYQEFELVHWYILCPFKMYVDDDEVVKRERLLAKDVGLGKLGEIFVNIEEYQRKE